MCDKTDKVMKLLKLSLKAGTPKEAQNARFQAMRICIDHDLDYDALIAQAAKELAVDNPEPRSAGAEMRRETTWNDVPREIYDHATKYDPRDDASRALLARAIRDVLTLAGFTYMEEIGARGETKEEVWDKVVGRGPKGDIRVKIYTSIINGHTDASGKRAGGLVRGLGTDQIRFCSPGYVSSKTVNGRKGHTVKRVGRFGDWREGRDDRAKNNPGILGRIWREILNVTDAALVAANGAPTANSAPNAEAAEAFIARMMRDYREDLSNMPHPSKAQAAQGKTMWGYVSWVLADSRNRYDRNGNDRLEFARAQIEEFMG